MLDPTHPKVTIITSTYNRAHLLGQAIVSAQTQTFPDFEHIIIDDGSQDNTRDVVARFPDPRVRYIHQENAGLATNRNTDIRLARGEYVAFLDDDDVYLSNKLADHVALMDSAPEIGWTAGGFQIIDGEGKTLDELLPWLHMPHFTVKDWLLKCPVCPAAVLVRKRWLERIEGFDKTVGTPDDWDVWLRLAHAGCPMGWTKSVVARYRVHGTNMVRDGARAREGRIALLDKFFAQPDLVLELRSLKRQVYAQAYLEGTGREYAAGQIAAASNDLAMAIELAPELLEDRGKAVVDMIAAYAAGPSIADPIAFTNMAFDNLPASARSLSARRRKTIGQAAMSRVFRAQHNGCRPEILRMIAVVARYDPSQLRDRGIWSILFRSLLGLPFT